MESRELLALAEAAQRSWQPQWSGFLDGASQERAIETLSQLSDLHLQRWGGFAGAERQRLRLCHAGVEQESTEPGDLVGLELLGNFLFDPTEADEFRQALHNCGVAAEALGDLWLRGDRGAQGVALGVSVQHLDGTSLNVRSVETRIQLRALEELQPPPA
jgi:RNA-binding protein YlmH